MPGAVPKRSRPSGRPRPRRQSSAASSAAPRQRLSDSVTLSRGSAPWPTSSAQHRFAATRTSGASTGRRPFPASAGSPGPAPSPILPSPPAPPPARPSTSPCRARCWRPTAGRCSTCSRIISATGRGAACWAGAISCSAAARRSRARRPASWSGDLSGIAAKEVPLWARPRYFPPLKEALAADWEAKIARLAPLSLATDIRTVSGTPSWLLIFFDKLAALRPEAPHRLASYYPNLELLVHGARQLRPLPPTLRSAPRRRPRRAARNLCGKRRLHRGRRPRHGRGPAPHPR